MSKSTDVTSASATSVAAIAAATQAADAVKTAAVNAAIVANDISYIKKDITEIKNSINSFPTIFISRSEFDTTKELVKEHSKQLEQMERIMYLGIGGLTVITFILKFLIK